MIKLLSLFSGIGAFEKAFKNLGIEYELVNYCEIDKFASKAFSLIHEELESKNLGDITKVIPENIDDFDLMTYGFPCQSFSIAGKRLGLKDPVKGNLFFESMKIVKAKKPKYLIAENVKGLLSDDSGETFQTILITLNKLGYNNYFKVLNAKDYGIPQNRERIFIISIRQDIDDYSFDFPEKQELKTMLYDLLEKEVDKKYYIKNMIITSMDDKTDEQNLIQLGYINKNSQGQRVYQDNMSTTIQAAGGGMGAKTGLYIVAQRDNMIVNNQSIRRLTPKECFRLMGFDDSDYYKLDDISDTQKYKMAGNSIVVNVLEGILKNLFLNDNKKKWLF